MSTSPITRSVTRRICLNSAKYLDVSRRNTCAGVIISRSFTCSPHTSAKRTYSTTFTRSATSAAALKRPPALGQPTFSQQIQALPEVQLNDLPITSMGEHKVAVGWDTRTWSRFHHIWLRDHCRCPKCFHAITKQRLVNTFEIPSDIKPILVESKPDGLEVTWPSSDPHVSLYPWSWLQMNSYDPPVKRNDPSRECVYPLLQL